jgi:phosphohistidine phosphatase SixA
MKELSQMKAKELACFGHAPNMDLLVAYLAGARGPFTELKKSGAVCFEHGSAHGKWMLKWILTPKMLRDLAE